MLQVCDLIKSEAGRDVFVVGTGTSLTDFDFSCLAGRRTIALNDAVFAFSPTYLLFTDYIAGRYANLALKGTHVVCPHGYQGAFRSVKFAGKLALFEPTPKLKPPRAHRLYVESTVAATGVYLAYLLGANRIFLLGVDAYRQPQARYWNGKLASNSKRYKIAYQRGEHLVERHHLEWVDVMRGLREFFTRQKLYRGSWPASGVYNLNPESVIDAWPSVAMASVLGTEESPGPLNRFPDS